MTWFYISCIRQRMNCCYSSKWCDLTKSLFLDDKLLDSQRFFYEKQALNKVHQLLCCCYSAIPNASVTFRPGIALVSSQLLIVTINKLELNNLKQMKEKQALVTDNFTQKIQSNYCSSLSSVPGSFVDQCLEGSFQWSEYGPPNETSEERTLDTSLLALLMILAPSWFQLLFLAKNSFFPS